MIGRFSDFDDLAATISSWDFDFRPLDGGSAPSEVIQLAASEAVIQRIELGNAYDQRGVSPAGLQSFGLVESAPQGVRLHGRDLPTAAIPTFRSGGEFAAVSRPGFVAWTLAIDEAHLEETMDSVGLPDTVRPRAGQPGFVSADPVVIRRTAERLGGLFDGLAAGEIPLDSAALGDELAFQIPLDLVLTMASGAEPAVTPSWRARDLALRRAIAFIEDNPGEPLTVRSLVCEAGVGWTTLVAAFQEHFGVTPKAYLQAIRLAGVRRGLREADPETRVVDVANRWGFWHQGQFASDYRRKFGELPSETLGRTLPSFR